MMKLRDVEFTKQHKMEIYESGKIVTIGYNGVIGSYLFNINNRTIDKIFLKPISKII